MHIVAEYQRLWQDNSAPPDVVAFIEAHRDAAPDQLLSVLHDDQKHRWRTDHPITVEEYLRRLTDLPEDVDWVLQLAIGEFEARRVTERPLSEEEISSRFPDLSDTLRECLQKAREGESPEVAFEVEFDPLCDEFEAAWQDTQQRPDLENDLLRRPVHVHAKLLEALLPIELWWRRQRGEQPTRTDYESRFPQHIDLLNKLLEEPEAQLTRRLQERRQRRSTTVSYITGHAVGVDQKGRYRLDRVLGEGGFGRVYLGYDDELRRQVAIKVPTKERFQKPEDAEAYLAEARTVASLDHPHIVPVYDMGRTDDGSVYVISRFIDGSTLEDRIKSGGLSDRDTAELIATVATALHFAHQLRLIHRDVKPANILIEDSRNTAFVADFGLALREEDYLQQNALAGTPAYMSPEQARGEGHRLDGRSDVFALGVILYERLPATHPFAICCCDAATIQAETNCGEHFTANLQSQRDANAAPADVSSRLPAVQSCSRCESDAQRRKSKAILLRTGRSDTSDGDTLENSPRALRGARWRWSFPSR